MQELELNGFTKIDNELLEAIPKYPFTAREIKIILVIIRFTNGFHRQEAELSLRFISNATGIKFQHISSSIEKLKRKNVISISGSKSHKQGRLLLLNKNYESWNFDSSQKGDSSQKSDGRVPKRVTVEFPKEGQNSSQKSDKERKNKEKLNIYLNKKDFSFSNVIPLELVSIENFREVWNEFIQHRKEIKKPLTPMSTKKLFNQLIKFHQEGFDVNEIINTSITNGWQGLFKPKVFKNYNKTDKGASPEDLARLIAKRFEREQRGEL